MALLKNLSFERKQLNLAYTNITELPDGDYNGYDLNLSHCNRLIKLPANMKLEYLWLNGCANLTELPAGLEVKNILDITGCPMIGLPEDLKVGGTLYANNTLLSKL